MRMTTLKRARPDPVLWPGRPALVAWKLAHIFGAVF
jgi:hypothetical protein